MIFNDKGEPVKMGYDGAESVSRHRNWLNNNSPVDHSEEQVLDFHKRNTLVAHLYDLYRSDTICYAIVEAMVTNISTPRLISQTGNDEYDQKREKLFSRFFLNCEVSGLSMAEVIRLIIRELCLAGECFILLGSKKLQMIEGNRIATDPKNKKKQEVEGVVLNSEGTPTSYRICGFDKNGRLDVKNGKYVSARNCIHIAHRTRINSIRGIPLMASCVSHLKDISELIKASVNKAKVSSLLTAFVKSETNFHQMHNVNGYDEPLRSSHTSLKTGSICYLEPNESIEILKGGDIGNLDAFIRERVADCLSTLGLSLECLRSYSNSSYASSRATRSMLAHKFNEYRSMLETKGLNRVAFWYSAKLNKEGILTAPADIDMQDYKLAWKAIPTLDAQKDAVTHNVLLKNGMTNLSKIQGEKGEDWTEILEGRAKELSAIKEIADKYGINASMLMPEYSFDQPLDDSDEVDNKT